MLLCSNLAQGLTRRYDVGPAILRAGSRGGGSPVSEILPERQVVVVHVVGRRGTPVVHRLPGPVRPRTGDPLAADDVLQAEPFSVLRPDQPLRHVLLFV